MFQFAAYYLWLTSMSLVMIPLSLLRPGSVDNARLGSLLMLPLSKVLQLDWKVEGEVMNTLNISSPMSCLLIYPDSFISPLPPPGQVELLQREESCVIVANHQSSIDLLGMFVIWSQLRRVAALAKQSLMYYGSFGERVTRVVGGSLSRKHA